MSPNSTSVEVGRASRNVMHEGAVRVMAEDAGGRTLPVPGGTAGRRRQVKGVHDVLPHREEVVREDVNEDAMQIRHHGRESVTKGTVQTRTDFSGEPPVE